MKAGCATPPMDPFKRRFYPKAVAKDKYDVLDMLYERLRAAHELTNTSNKNPYSDIGSINPHLLTDELMQKFCDAWYHSMEECVKEDILSADCRLEQEKLLAALAKQLKAVFAIGDIVTGAAATRLRSGAQEYSHAIVVAIDPLQLVSEETDMLWSHTEGMFLQIVGKASPALVKRCQRRIKED